LNKDNFFIFETPKTWFESHTFFYTVFSFFFSTYFQNVKNIMHHNFSKQRQNQMLYFVFNRLYGSFFLLGVIFKAYIKMKIAQWGFSLKKSNIHILKQLCLYFNYLMGTV